MIWKYCIASSYAFMKCLAIQKLEENKIEKTREIPEGRQRKYIKTCMSSIKED